MNPCALTLLVVTVPPYRITLSALASTLGGIVRPLGFAVLRLMMNSNFVGASTGKSCGLVPFNIRFTYQAPRLPLRYRSGSYDNRAPDSITHPVRGNLFCIATPMIFLQGSPNSPLLIIKMPSVVCLETERTASSASPADLIGFSVSLSPNFGAISCTTVRLIAWPGFSPLAL